MNLHYFSLIKDALLKVWPEHGRVVEKSLAQRDESLLVFTEQISSMIYKIISDDLESYCLSYKWTCEMLNQEEIYFRRSGKYRFSTLSEVENVVYHDHSFMNKYVKGLLLTQILWTNHINTIWAYNNFLESQPIKSIIEIGPGHGLLVALAGIKGIKDITVWDISESSLLETKKNLTNILPGIEVNYLQVDALNVSKLKSLDKKYDAIVLSEVLEHIEFPQTILKNLREVMNPDSRIFINIPVNCPAPDHIYYLDKADDVVELVQGAGLQTANVQQYPLTGYTLEAALKRRFTISVCLTATAH